MLNEIIKEVYENMTDKERRAYNIFLEKYKENDYDMVSYYDEDTDDLFIFSLTPIHVNAKDSHIDFTSEH